jgi:hypothetical protein
LVFRRPMFTHSLLTLFSSLTQLEVFVLVGLFCSLFGSPAFVSCGMNETIVCLETRQVPLLSCWRKSKYPLFGGWRLQMLLLFPVIIHRVELIALFEYRLIFCILFFFLLHGCLCNIAIVLFGTPCAIGVYLLLLYLYIFCFNLLKKNTIFNHYSQNYY